jgi:hypothetical protein
MKYFQPELLARCRSSGDDGSDAAAQEWEHQIITYRRRLTAIGPRLPASVRRLIARVSLHDAKVLTLAFAQRQPRKLPWFTILIGLESTPSQPGDVLELSYLLAQGKHGGVSFQQHPHSKRDTSGLGWILYDEFDSDSRRGFFTHCLLLTGGDEVAVRFHNLRVRRLGEARLPPLELPVGERPWPLVVA